MHAGVRDPPRLLLLAAGGPQGSLPSSSCRLGAGFSRFGTRCAEFEIPDACQILGLYKPLVWEYSRLKITHTVMSKRKLKALVELGHVRGWDDPRLPTLAAMRRRGYTAQVPNSAVHPVPDCIPSFPVNGLRPVLWLVNHS